MHASDTLDRLDDHPKPHVQPEFWEKFGADAPASFAGKTILEVGCGFGGRSFELAEAGATVVGIDPSATCIKGAKEHLEALSPIVAERVTLRQCRIQDIESRQFDIAISEDTFEHLTDVSAVLDEMRKTLVKGGRAYIGFGPLYHSPYGDHGWIQKNLPFGKLPWSHLYLPQKMTYRIVGRKLGKPIHDTVNWPFLALNQLTVSDFKRLFRASGMKVVRFRVGKHTSVSGRIVDVLARVPGLRKYFSDGIYAVLERVD